MNPYYPDLCCHFCQEKATKKFTGLLGFSKCMCDECAIRYREWYPRKKEEDL